VLRPTTADYPPGTGLPSRVIEDFEFVWMLQGVAQFTADEDIALEPGELLLVPPGVRHRFQWDQARPSRHGYVHFAPTDVNTVVVPEVRLIQMSSDPMAGLCAYLLWIGGSNHEGWQNRVRLTLEFMLTLVQSGPLPGVADAPALSRPMHAAISHLQGTWSHPPLRRVGVAELAEVVHVSRGYLNRLFQAEFGVSAAAALERLRSGRAEALLTGTDLTIAAIARQCGYADVGHFSHRFSGIYRVSPTAYRAAMTRAPSVLDHPGVLRLSRLVWQ
jgi:AraC family transcriptional regulator